MSDNEHLPGFSVGRIVDLGAPFGSLAAPLTVQPWPLLQKPARVGATCFGVGVSCELVIDAAIRAEEAHQEQLRPKTLEQLQAAEKARRELWDSIHGSPDGAVLPLARRPVDAAEVIEVIDRVLDEVPCDCAPRKVDAGDHDSGCPLFDLAATRARLQHQGGEPAAQEAETPSAELDAAVDKSWERFEAEMNRLKTEKAQRVHALVNGGQFPGMSEAFDAHMGASCWTDPAYAPDASTWAAAWKAALGAAQEVRQEPAMFVSPLQFAALQDPEGEFGAYLPARKTPAGKFTVPLYTAPQPQEPVVAQMVYFRRKGVHAEDCVPVIGDPYKQVDRALVTRIVPLCAAPQPVALTEERCSRFAAAISELARDFAATGAQAPKSEVDRGYLEACSVAAAMLRSKLQSYGITGEAR